jgi:hypothetical protein
MNYKGIKDKKYTCLNCSAEFGFKDYSGYFHKFCSIRCSSEFRAKEGKEKSLEKFNSGNLRNRRTIYKLLLERDGNGCSICGITEWLGSPIRLWVDHIDGNAANNLPENFRLICPNCDSQSDTFGGRNRGNGRRSRGLTPYG